MCNVTGMNDVLQGFSQAPKLVSPAISYLKPKNMKNVFQNKVAAFEFIHWVRDSKRIIQVSTRVEALKSFHGVTRATYQAFFLMQEHMLETTDFRISLTLSTTTQKAFCKPHCCFSAS